MLRDNNIDVKKLVAFIREAKIISYKQAVAFLRNNGLSNKRAESVIGIVKSKNLTNFTPTNGFIYSSSLILNDNKMQAFSSVDKLNWLYIDLQKFFDSANYECKYPCKAFFYNSKGEENATVFKVRKEFIQWDCQSIETNFGTQNAEISPIDTIILVDNEENIDDIFLSDCFNIVAFAVVKYLDNANAEVKYFDKYRNEIEVDF